MPSSQLRCTTYLVFGDLMFISLQLMAAWNSTVQSHPALLIHSFSALYKSSTVLYCWKCFVLCVCVARQVQPMVWCSCVLRWLTESWNRSRECRTLSAGSKVLAPASSIFTLKFQTYLQTLIWLVVLIPQPICWHHPTTVSTSVLSTCRQANIIISTRLPTGLLLADDTSQVHCQIKS